MNLCNSVILVAEDTQRLAQWFVKRVPTVWFTAAPSVLADRDEILVVGDLPHPGARGKDHPAAPRSCAGQIDRFREATRDARVRIAQEAEAKFARRVSWGATCGAERRVFTNWSVPVMTRLRLPERSVLDTLVGAGVARSRSDALAWCVRLVGANQDEWLADLRRALEAVESLRAGGPRAN
jgi:hypothetical protein